MKIIGLTCHYTGNHDNSAALLLDGKIVFAESEERISRIKHDTQFPVRAIRHALKFTGLEDNKIDYFASGSPPTNTLRLLLSYLAGFRYTSMKEILKWALDRGLFMLANKLSKKVSARKNNLPENFSESVYRHKKLIYISHYLAHAETAFCFSGMHQCLVIAWDGYGLKENGEPICGSVYLGKEGSLTLLEEIPAYSSIALYYGAVTICLGFKLNDGEGKTMGLAAYGKESPAINALKKLLPHFNRMKWVPKTTWLEVNGVSRPDYFRKTSLYKKIKSLIGKYGSEQVAYATQKILEEEGEKFFKYLVKKYKEKKVAVAGGIFLNVKFNMRLLKNKVVDRIFIYPNPADGGVAVGAAIAAYKRLNGKFEIENMESAALGCEWSNTEVARAINSFKKKITVRRLGSKLCQRVARDLVEGGVIGWFQGRGEWGPRALGSRSVLADPRKKETKERINKYLKQREWFMPFAPVIMEEFKDKVLQNGYATPFMTLADDVKPSDIKKIPAAIHIDGTARAQIIKREVNPSYWRVVYEFYKLTGVPVLLNTSFNRHGLSIVHSPKEAIEHLLWGCVDELAINDYLIIKK